MFFTILSCCVSEIPFLTRLTSECNASLNKNPPSRGTIGRTLNKATARLSQKIQYNALIMIQKTFEGIMLRGPVIMYESVNGATIGLYLV